MEFKKAVKSSAKLRAALFGPSGAGKTWSALAVGSGMGGALAVIDSERGSASKYADRFSFDCVNLKTKTVEEYVAAIKTAAAAGYAVLIIDSLSHAWQTLNEEVEKIADARYKGNFWAAWSEGTPQQRKLIEAIISYPGHVIATMRSKTEWQAGGGGGEKTRPVRVGLAPEQGKGIEYEFDILLEITPEHLASVIKDRTGKFQDRIIEKPGREFGKELAGWLNEGAEAPPPEPAPERGAKPEAEESLRAEFNAAKEELKNILQSEGPDGSAFFTRAEYDDAAAAFAALKGKPAEECMETARSMLAVAKARLRERHDALTAAPAPPAAAVPPAPPAPLSQAAAPGAAPPKNGGAIMERFQQRITKAGNSGAEEAAPPPPGPGGGGLPLPSMYSQEEPGTPGGEEDDGFEDDIPEDFTAIAGKAPAEAELGIF